MIPSPSAPQLPAPLILASQSPRRRQLLEEAGYAFQVDPPDDAAECAEDVPRETPSQLVTRLAVQKARSVAERHARGIVVGCDTVAVCEGRVLGKPASRDDARRMLELLRGRPHQVYSGLCLWHRPSDRMVVDVDVTELTMDAISDEQLEAYLDTGAWQGKAGAFGYQDGLDWVHVRQGSESNVVGLPLELLERLLQQLQPPADR